MSRRRKLSDANVELLRRLYRARHSLPTDEELAALFKLHVSQVSRVGKGLIYKQAERTARRRISRKQRESRVDNEAPESVQATCKEEP